MSKSIDPFNAANLLEQLSQKRLITNDHELADFIITQHHKKTMPLYLKAAICFGAWIPTSSILFFFLVIKELLEWDNLLPPPLFSGLILVAFALFIQKIAHRYNQTMEILFLYSSFICMIAGKIIFAWSLPQMFGFYPVYLGWGVTQALHSAWGTTLGFFIITAITYKSYPLSIERFLSSFYILLQVGAILWSPDNANGSHELLLNGFFFCQLTLLIMLSLCRKITYHFMPLKHALMCSLSIYVTGITLISLLSPSWAIINPWFMNIVLTCGLIALFGWAAGGMEKLKSIPLLLASLGAVLLGLLSIPGLLFAIGLMVLGYAKHEKQLSYIGILLLLVFLFLYYFMLDVSMAYKSVILIGSGITLLSARLYLKKSN